MQRAPELTLARRGRSTEAGPSPSPLRPGLQPGVAGTAGPGRALQLPQDDTPDTPVSGRQRLPPGRSACSTQRSVARRGGRLPSRRIRGPLSVPA